LKDSNWAANKVLKKICDGLAEFEHDNEGSILIISVADAFSLCEEFYQTLRSKLHDSRRYNAAASRKAFKCSTEEPDSAGTKVTKRSRKRERQEHDEPPVVVGLPIALCEIYDTFTSSKGPFARIRQSQNRLKDIEFAVKTLRTTLVDPNFPANDRHAIHEAFTQGWHAVDVLASIAANGVAQGLCLVSSSKCVELCDLLISYCTSAWTKTRTRNSNYAATRKLEGKSPPGHEKANGNAVAGGGASFLQNDAEIQFAATGAWQVSDSESLRERPAQVQARAEQLLRETDLNLDETIWQEVGGDRDSAKSCRGPGTQGLDDASKISTGMPNSHRDPDIWEEAFCPSFDPDADHGVQPGLEAAAAHRAAARDPGPALAPAASRTNNSSSRRQRKRLGHGDRQKPGCRHGKNST
jgi:hypothetical protein